MTTEGDIGTIHAWYLEDDATRAKTVIDITEAFWQQQGQGRLALAQDCLELYLGSTRHSLMGRVDPLEAVLAAGTDPSSFNVVYAATETFVAHTVKNRVRPLVLTEGGDTKLRERAEAMQEAIEGMFYELGLYEEVGIMRCRDGYLFEGGGIEWTPDIANSRILADRIACWEYFVPSREARFGRPRQTFARHAMDRAVLGALFKNAPKSVRDEIADAKPASQDDVYEDIQIPGRIADQVIVYKAWHLPSGRVDLKDQKTWGKGEDGRRVEPNHDGRHAIAIQGRSGPVLLPVPEAWPYDYFPQSWFKPLQVPGSFWGRGVPEVIAGQQQALNRWNTRIDRILDLHARPFILLWKQAKLSPNRISNALGNIFETAVPPGQAMQQVAAPSVPQDLLNRPREVQQWAREQLGQSEMSMYARKPTGLNHEPGMEHMQDTETLRHTPEFRQWEKAHLDDGKNLLRCLRVLAEHDKDFTITFGNDDQLKKAKWKELDLDADKFKMKAWGANLFALTPAQRAKQVIEYLKLGLITPEEAMVAIDAPDTKRILGNRTAIEKNINKKLDRIARGEQGEELMPHPYMDLQKTKDLGLRKINELEANGEPWDRIDAVIKFLEDVDALLPPPPPPGPPPGPPSPGMPPGPPMNGAAPMMPPGV